MFSTCGDVSFHTVFLQETEDSKGPSYTAIYDFTGQDSSQLTFKRGETVCPVVSQRTDRNMSRYYCHFRTLPEASSLSHGSQHSLRSFSMKGFILLASVDVFAFWWSTALVYPSVSKITSLGEKIWCVCIQSDKFT